MSTSALVRITGFAALLAGLTSLVSHLSAVAGIVPDALDGYRSFAVLFINLFTITGLYAAQANRAGVTGLAGYVLGVLGLAGNVGLRFVMLFVAPILGAQFPEAYAAVGAGPFGAATSITFIVYALGFILFGIATFRADVLPRWAGALMAVGALLSYVLMLPVNVGGLLVSASFAWLGWSLAAGQTLPALSAQRQAT